MADVTYTYTATERKANTGAVAGKGDANNVKVAAVFSHALVASASGTTVKIGTVQSNLRILPQSHVYWDDLATSGSPTLDIGFGSVDSNITSDPDALNDGLDVTSASNAALLKEITDAGLPAWQIAGASSDPGGLLDVYATVKDAATNAAGDIVVSILGYTD